MKNLRMLVLLGFLALAGALGLTGCLTSNTPHANFTATPEYDYPPLEVEFDASASTSPNGDIVSYEWDFGDDETDTGVTVSHTYTEKGVYPVTLIVTDTTGATGARTKPVEALNRVPVAVIDASGIYTVGVNDPLWLDGRDSYDPDPDGEIVEYLWDFGDGTSDEGALVSHEYTSATAPTAVRSKNWKPTITLRVVDNDGGVSQAATYEVVVVGCDCDE
jgi:PKD repeat protein